MSCSTQSSGVACVEFVSYETSVGEALESIQAAETLGHQRRIILKPNLVQASPHPVTTPPECVAAVIEYCRAHTRAEILIAEGSGGGDTLEVFESLGYAELSRQYRVLLVDLDRDEVVRLTREGCRYLREFYAPKTVLNGFLVSMPVLKAHSMSQVTLSLKNMLGIAPASRYKASAFRKSKLHGKNNRELHQYIVELNHYRKPDLSLVDATVGMAEAHLWGPPCDPPVNRIIAGFDPVAVDAMGAELLGIDWRSVDHIASANGRLGVAAPDGPAEG